MKHSKKKDKRFKRIIISLIFIPAFTVLYVIGLNSNYLIRKPVFYLILVLLIALFILLFVNLVSYNKNKGEIKRKLKKKVKIFLIILYCIYFVCCNGFLILLYGRNDKFRTWLITTAMQTMNHQYLCKWFYNNDIINQVINNNKVEESGESTDTSLVKHKDKFRKETYKDEYEKEILDVDDDTKYKIIELNVNGCKGYLAAIYDPSKVKVATTDYIGVKGEYVTTMAEKRNALLAINAGGFYDPGNSSRGGTPTGITISEGKIITNGEYGNNNQGGGIIGFTNDNVLMLVKNKTAQQALDMGIRDAVSWGPFLIVNGKPSFIRGNGGWGYAARSAIGQREDGIVLLLVIDSNSTRTKGADMVDLSEIMQRYGAINAANLDGGTSSVMVMPREIAKSKYNARCTDYYTKKYCAINDPIDGELKHQTRPIADSWVVVE